MRWPKHTGRMGASQTLLPGCGKRAGSISSGLHSRLLVGVTSTSEDLLLPSCSGAGHAMHRLLLRCFAEETFGSNHWYKLLTIRCCMTEDSVRSKSKPQLTANSIDLLAESILPITSNNN